MGVVRSVRQEGMHFHQGFLLISYIMIQINFFFIDVVNKENLRCLSLRSRVFGNRHDSQEPRARALMRTFSGSVKIHRNFIQR